MNLVNCKFLKYFLLTLNFEETFNVVENQVKKEVFKWTQINVFFIMQKIRIDFDFRVFVRFVEFNKRYLIKFDSILTFLLFEFYNFILKFVKSFKKRV